MCGIFLFQHLFQSVHKPQNGGSVEAFGVDSRIFDERVISTVYQCVGIKQEKVYRLNSYIYPFFHGKSTKKYRINRFITIFVLK